MGRNGIGAPMIAPKKQRARRAVPSGKSCYVFGLAAARGAAAIFALVAGAIGRHKHAALGTSRRAVEYGTRSRAGGWRIVISRCNDRRGHSRRGGYACRRQSSLAIMREIVGRNKPSAEPPRNVIEHRLGVRNCRMAGVASGLEARVDEFIDQRLERNAVLQADRNRKREAVHESRERRAFLGHLDEDLARLSGFVQT